MKHIFYKAFFTCLTIGFISCDKDPVDLDSDISGAQNFSVNKAEFPVVAYSKQTGPVQANNLPQRYLGVLKDDTFGTVVTSNVISEITPTSFSPDFGTGAVIDSVILNVPYYSKVISTDADGRSTYELDSIFGNPNTGFQLSILKSNYLLRELDPATNFEEFQRYYSDFYTSTLESLDDNTSEYIRLFETNDFKPTSNQWILELNDDQEELLRPSLRVDLTTGADAPAFWNDLLIANQDADYLVNSSSFKEFFRGLIFKIEGAPVDGSLFGLDFSSIESRVVVYYHNDENPDGELRYSFNFNGLRTSTFKNTSPISLPTADEQEGDDNLYLKGFEGSFAVVDLFGAVDTNGYSDELENFKSKKDQWLINEANLTFYVDQNQINGEEPKRVTLYDLNNNKVIDDYNFDLNQDVINPENSRTNFSEPLTTDASGNGVRYKLRITQHLNNILLRDSTNVKLGLFVTNNINNLGTSQLKNPLTVGLTTGTEVKIANIPQNTVLSDKGTVLYGTSSNVPDDKKVKLEIYYTEEN